jgi:hypothetical protein
MLLRGDVCYGESLSSWPEDFPELPSAPAMYLFVYVHSNTLYKIISLAVTLTDVNNRTLRPLLSHANI